MNEDQKKLRLERINAKGMGVNSKLVELLAGKEVDLSALDASGIDPIDNKEMRLRDYLDRINAARKRLMTGAYGSCLACGVGFSDPELDETPWLEVCGDCGQKGAPYDRWPKG